jgi:hypothetical protein
MLDRFLVGVAHAQFTGGGGTALLPNPIKVDSLKEFIALLLSLVVQIGIPLLIVAFVYVGFLFVQAQGNPGKRDLAKKALLNTVIGAAIVLGAGVISEALQLTIDKLK